MRLESGKSSFEITGLIESVQTRILNTNFYNFAAYEGRSKESCEETGNLIRIATIKKGLSLEELAKKSNVSAATILKIEKGERNFRLTTFYSIASALEVKMNSLIGDKEVMIKRLLDID